MRQGKNIPKDCNSLYLQLPFQSGADRLSHCILKASQTQAMLVIRNEEIYKKYQSVYHSETT